MAKRRRPSTNKTLQKSAQRVAFELATTLAKKSEVLRMEIAPLDMHEGLYYEHLESIRGTLQQAHADRGATATKDVEELLVHVADPDTRLDVANAMTTVMSDAQDAGYLYGLALGLILASHPTAGGAR